MNIMQETACFSKIAPLLTRQTYARLFNEESTTDLRKPPKSPDLNVRKYTKFVVANRTKRNNESRLKTFILDCTALIRNDQTKDAPFVVYL